MSSRLTKKSLVSAPGLLGQDAVARAVDIDVDRAQTADQHRQLGRGRASAAAPCRSAALRRGTGVAGPSGSCGSRPRPARGTANDSTSVCACEASVRPGENGTGHVVTGRLRRLLDAGIARQHDQVGERDLLAAVLAQIELELDALERLEHLASCSGLVGVPVLLRSEADTRAVGAAALVAAAEGRGRAQAVPTSSETLRPDASDLGLECGGIGVVDQRMIDGRAPDPARSALPSALPDPGSASAGPDRDGSA